MAKNEAKQAKPSKGAATKAFKRAWKLLGRLEKRLAAARADESKRRRQLLEATGDERTRRQGQLDAAVARAGQAATLLTELSEMIAANARAQAGQTVSDIAHEAAEAIRAEERAKSAALAEAPAKPIVRRTRTPAAGPRGARRKSPATPAPGRTTTPVRPRTRRSLQPGGGGSGESSS
jgi:hypothetical protein